MLPYAVQHSSNDVDELLAFPIGSRRSHPWFHFSFTDSTAHAASAKKRTWSVRSPVKRP